MTPASGRNRENARPGCGFERGEAKPARIQAPANPIIADKVTTARKKFSCNSEKKTSAETLLATSWVPSCEMPAVTRSWLNFRRKYSSTARTVAMRPTEAATIHSRPIRSAASNRAITPRPRLPRKMCARARATRNGCRDRKKSSSLSLTGSVFRYWTRPNRKRAIAVPPTVQRQRISPNVSEGRRKAARNPSAVGEMAIAGKHTSFQCHPEEAIGLRGTLRTIDSWNVVEEIFYSACSLSIPVHHIEAFRRRRVPHGRFAPAQDDRDLLHHDVNHLAGHVNLLDDLFARDGSLDFLVREGAANDELFHGIGGHNHAPAQLAIDLHGNFDL